LFKGTQLATALVLFMQSCPEEACSRKRRPYRHDFHYGVTKPEARRFHFWVKEQCNITGLLAWKYSKLNGAKICSMRCRNRETKGSPVTIKRRQMLKREKQRQRNERYSYCL